MKEWREILEDLPVSTVYLETSADALVRFVTHTRQNLSEEAYIISASEDNVTVVAESNGKAVYSHLFALSRDGREEILKSELRRAALSGGVHPERIYLLGEGSLAGLFPEWEIQIVDVPLPV